MCQKSKDLFWLLLRSCPSCLDVSNVARVILMLEMQQNGLFKFQELCELWPPILKTPNWGCSHQQWTGHCTNITPDSSNNKSMQCIHSLVKIQKQVNLLIRKTAKMWPLYYHYRVHLQRQVWNTQLTVLAVFCMPRWYVTIHYFCFTALINLYWYMSNAVLINNFILA